MNKLLKAGVMCLSIATLLSSCSGGGGGNKQKTVNCTVGEYFEKYKNNFDKSTKYHMIGVQPYNFGRGDGKNYPNNSYYMFVDNNDDSSKYFSARVVSSKSVTFDNELGEYWLKGDYDQANEFENSEFKDATKNWTFEINLFLLRINTTSSNFAVEILNATAPSE